MLPRGAGPRGNARSPAFAGHEPDYHSLLIKTEKLKFNRLLVARRRHKLVTAPNYREYLVMQARGGIYSSRW